MNKEELALAKKIGEQMDGKILCPRECVEGQELSTFGDFEDRLFCPHCELEVELVVRYPEPVTVELSPMERLARFGFKPTTR